MKHACSFCGNINSNSLFEKKGSVGNIPFECEVAECLRCGTWFSSVIPSQKEVGKYYEADYGPYKNQLTVRVMSGALPKILLQKILGVSLKTTDNHVGKTILEVGCSNGAYLQRFKSSNVVVGQEMSQQAGQLAINKGLDVVIGEYLGSDLGTSRYDFIYAWMVLEHFYNLNDSLAKLKNELKPNGTLHFSVPDMDSWIAKKMGDRAWDWSFPFHVTHFQRKKIISMLTSSGFKNIKIYSQISHASVIKSLSQSDYRFIRNCADFIDQSPTMKPIRVLFAFALALTRQSGRIEVTCQRA